MTEQKAIEEGLQFTGHSYPESQKDKIKAKAKAIRDQGFRAVVVRVKSSGRWGTVYSEVYASPEYEKARLTWENYKLAPQLLQSYSKHIDDLKAEIASFEAKKLEVQALLDGPAPKEVY